MFSFLASAITWFSSCFPIPLWRWVLLTMRGSISAAFSLVMSPTSPTIFEWDVATQRLFGSTSSRCLSK